MVVMLGEQIAFFDVYRLRALGSLNGIVKITGEFNHE